MKPNPLLVANLKNLAAAYAGSETGVHLAPANFAALKAMAGGSGDGLPDDPPDEFTHVRVSAKRLCEIVAGESAEGDAAVENGASPAPAPLPPDDLPPLPADLPDDLNGLTVKELRSLAKDQRVELSAGLDKAGVVDAVTAGIAGRRRGPGDAEAGSEPDDETDDDDETE